MKKILALCFLLLAGFFAQAQSTEDYIAERVEFAQSLMRDYKVPASLILAVAIHESAAGKSKIAQYLNNHFGIKGPNSSDKIRSSYRDYDNVEESYSHFIEMLETRSPFNTLFSKYDQYDYKGWARGIQRCGYAHSRSWASQVIGLISKYELYNYDERPADYVEPVYASTPQKNTRYSSKKKTAKSYTIKPGDNLSTIAKKKGTTVKSLMQKNNLKKSKLKPGQKLKV